ncbi:malto-oligosyltrehalose trehalohydrolase [Propionibacterium sp. oral taxon 192 str. F0372]|uniref:malto-oligosyltrehalose trehalohydrolase n=1 Tax=Propionibacterium sp. oral taxon 192 TaxID=671222 RepID=UPI0003532D20|nr:malto-oligosyltrehalose trehalohydrolase [Propionibacterium sp. oral taxon 192]EPH02902.1 malto-oligosyltrehalose trehalohydrolase [Propionibacterium sp. oral taxon 192 str. F0372]
MTGIRVWAPFASHVDAIIGERTEPMTPDGREYWRIDLAHGTDYLISVDGGVPRPDPRSAHQPHGVHGPSRVFDTSQFSWTDASWNGIEVLGGVIQEVHVGTWTPEGTLDAAITRLDHLVDLGVDTVELMPLASFAGDHGWGYDGVFWYAVHEAYGGPAALQRFVDAAHAHGIAVCLDVVYNHFGPAGNYTSTFGPYTTDRYTTPWGDAINLDGQHSRGVRNFICDNALRWFTEFHIDALRLDAVQTLHDSSTEHILAELSRRVEAARHSLPQQVVLIAESDLNQVRMVTPRSDGGLGIDAQWNDDVHHAIHAYLTDESFGYYVDFGSPEVLSKALEKVFVYDGGYSTFRGTNWGAPVDTTVDRRRFVVFTQDHDQIGNRGMGDRPDEAIPPGAVAGGIALVMLSSYTPMLFQGQEWGTRTPFRFFTDHDPELGALVTQGRLREFATHDWASVYGTEALFPDPQDPETFRGSHIDWNELDEPYHAEMYAWYKQLIALRRAYLRGIGTPVVTDHGHGWFRMVNGPLTVIVNPGQHPCSPAESRGRLLASWGEVTVGDQSVSMGTHSVAVLGE